jgi:hypothetical protein
MALSKSCTVRLSASCFHRPLLEALEDRTLPSFFPPVSYPVGTSPNAVAVADFNGDKIPDLVVTNRSAGTVSILLGKGDGTFQAARSFNANISPYYVAVGDFNGDGIPDLAVTNYSQAHSDSGVSVLLGKGEGSFGLPMFFPISSLGQPTGLATADLNHDGKLDLVVAYSGRIRITPLSVLLGNGDGSFQSAVDYGMGEANSLAVADLNGDGNPDVVIADPSNARVTVYLGDGTGAFPTSYSYSLGAGSYPNDVAIGDVNGDKIPDLVVMDESKKQLAVLLGIGKGTFQSSPMYSPVAGQSPGILVLGDFNKDGTLDAATADFDKNTVNVLLGNGDGTFSQRGQLYGVGNFPLGFAVGDFNRDGYPDLATVNFDSYDVSMLLNAADWVPGSATMTTLSASPNPSQFSDVVDFTATVAASGAIPTGDVQFVIDGDPAGTKPLDKGVASYTTSSLPAGQHTIEADYLPTPGSDFQGSSDTLTQTVNPAATTTMLSTSSNPSVAGEVVTFTAMVTTNGVTPAGDVEFSIDGSSYTTLRLSNGLASASTRNLSPGQHTIMASYMPTGNFQSSSGSLTQMVNEPTLTVTSTADSGPGSLRDALAAAVPGSTVTFASGLSGTITLLSTLFLMQDVTIDGPGASVLTVNGNGLVRVFDVAPGITVGISGLTIAGGSSLGDFGGGIYNDGTLALTTCTISGNTASPRGGGIYNSLSGTLTLTSSLVSGNSAPDAGGGIYNAGTMLVSFSTLSANGSATADGGAIFNEGTLTVTNSTFSGKNGGASAYGGAIRNESMLTVQESTFADNIALLGGAIYNAATLLILDSTIAANTAQRDGGGIENLGTGFSARNTIIAGNTAVAGSGPDLNGVLTSLGHNLIGKTSSASGFAATDLLNEDPLLGPLQDNGGPTQTMALLPGSPAIDAGDNMDAPQYDQRGPGFLRIVNGSIDIGAFEVQPALDPRVTPLKPIQPVQELAALDQIFSLESEGDSAARGVYSSARHRHLK